MRLTIDEGAPSGRTRWTRYLGRTERCSSWDPVGSNSTKIIRSSPVPVLVIPRGTDVHVEDTASIPRVE